MRTASDFARLRPGRRSRMLALLSMLSLVGPLSLARPSAAATAPQRPQRTVNTAFVAPTGKTINVGSGGDLQGALDAANPGDVIVLQAGATFTGNFTLPNKSGSGWITIETSAIKSLPPSGTRVSPSNASLMPKIVTSNSMAALATEASAHNYRIVGVEFTVASGTSINYGIVALGDGSRDQSSSYQVPHDLILDRVYIHGQSNLNVRRGVGLNSASSAVVDSYISEIHEAGADNQAIAGWNGPGPYKIDNNYLEAAGENVIFGGADPAIPNLVPSDIVLTHNYIKKQPSWRGSQWTVKNILELKNAQRVFVDGNVFEYNWLMAQNGFSILFTVRNQGGTAPWSVVQDVTFTHNIVRHVAQGVDILGYDNLHPSQQTKRILIKDNLFADIGGSWGQGRLFQVLSNSADVTIDHNTGLSTNSFIMADGDPNPGFVFQNNIIEHGKYGLMGSGTGDGTATLNAYFPGYVFQKNAIIGGTCGCYPAGNYFPANDAAVPITNAGGGDYSLASSSTYTGAGTDGKDLGVDWSALTGATRGVMDGSGGSSSGSTTPTNPPTSDPPSSDPTTTEPPPPTAGDGGTSGGTDSGGTVSGGAVTWTSVQHATVSGNSLRKTSGCEGCQDSGGLSKQTIASGDGLLTFTVDGSATEREVGLTSGTSKTVVRIDFGFLIWPNGNLSLEEHGAYKAMSHAVAGDTLGIAIQQGKVVFLKNGAVLYRSSTAPTYPLRAVASLISMNSTATNVTLTSGSASTGGGTTSSGTTDGGTTTDGGATTGDGTTTDGGGTTTDGGSTAAQAVVWTAVKHATVSGNSLRKTSGCEGCQDAGGHSAQAITSGDGLLTFTIDGSTTEREVGLSRHSELTVRSIDFGLLIWPNGHVSLEESGTYKVMTSVARGDTLSVGVSSGVVIYQKNGVTFYRSSKPPVYPLSATASLLSMRATVTNATMLIGPVPNSGVRTTSGSTIGTAVPTDATASQRKNGGN